MLRFGQAVCWVGRAAGAAGGSGIWLRVLRKTWFSEGSLGAGGAPERGDGGPMLGLVEEVMPLAGRQMTMERLQIEPGGRGDEGGVGGGG